MPTLVKAHAYGNDFLLMPDDDVPAGADRAALARAVCERHRGLGGDGLITFARSGRTAARMSLLNADGSYSELSGNGVRCLAAWLATSASVAADEKAVFEVVTDAGAKQLTLLGRTGNRFTFRAAMGNPENVRRERIDLGGVSTDVVTLTVGNPQCVVLGPVTSERLHSLAAALAIHPHFPAGTNVELAVVETPHQVRILIWERGVGPTEASGPGACAAAVAAMQFGGAQRDVQVIAPGGSQRVEWTAEGLFLTGEAEVIAECAWRTEVPSRA